MINSPLSQRLTRLTRAFTCAALAGAVLGGCASSDVVTFSRQGRQEGLKQYQEGNYADAGGSFRAAIRQNPRDYQSHYYLGTCYMQMEQYQQAVHAFKASLDTQNTTLEGRENDAFRYKTIDALAGAIVKADRNDVELNAVEQRARGENSAEKYLIVAKVYRLRGDIDSAIDAYNRASLLAPKDFYIARDYGLFLEQIQQPRQAERPLKRAYNLKPNDPEVIAALNRIGVVVGPSLLDEKNLEQPPLPKGPIPEVDWAKLGNHNAPRQPAPAPSAEPVITPAPAPSASVQSPRD